MGKFVISRRSDGHFQFVLKAGNGEVILTSQGYASRQGCANGIDSVRNNSQEDSKFHRREATDGRFYFNLHAANGEVIGNSQMYQSAHGRDVGIESVMTNAPKVGVEDHS